MLNDKDLKTEDTAFTEEMYKEFVDQMNGKKEGELTNDKIDFIISSSESIFYASHLQETQYAENAIRGYEVLYHRQASAEDAVRYERYLALLDLTYQYEKAAQFSKELLDKGAALSRVALKFLSMGTYYVEGFVSASERARYLEEWIAITDDPEEKKRLGNELSFVKEHDMSNK